MVKGLRRNKMSTINILHVSDLHVNAENAADRGRLAARVDAFLRDPVLKETPIDILAFTGDAAYTGTEAEFDRARDLFFEPLCDKTGIERDQILIVAGNHDIEQPDPETPEGREEKKRQAELRKKLWRADINEVNRLFLEQENHNPRLEHFYKFRQQLTGLPLTDPVHRKITLNDYEISLCGFNSAWRCTDSQMDPKNLFISEEQIARALGEGIMKSDLRIALVHHDSSWLHPDERYVVVEQLRQHFDIILYGHIHHAETDNQQSMSSAEWLQMSARPIHHPRVHCGYRIYRVDLEKSEVSFLQRRLYEDESPPGYGWDREPGSRGDVTFPLPRSKQRGPSTQEILERIVQAMLKTPPRVSSRFIGKQLFDTITKIGIEDIGADYCTVAVPQERPGLPEEHLRVISQAARDRSSILHDTGERIVRQDSPSSKRSISWLSVDQGGPITIHDVRTDSKYAKDYVPCCQGIQSEHIFPVFFDLEAGDASRQQYRREGLLAVVNFESSKSSFFTREKLRLVNFMAEILPLTIRAAYLQNTLHVLWLEERLSRLMSLLPQLFSPIYAERYNAASLATQWATFVRAMRQMLIGIYGADSCRVEVFEFNPEGVTWKHFPPQAGQEIVEPPPPPGSWLLEPDGIISLESHRFLANELQPYLCPGRRHVSVVTLPLGLRDRKMALISSVDERGRDESETEDREARLTLFHHLLSEFKRQLARPVGTQDDAVESRVSAVIDEISGAWVSREIDLKRKEITMNVSRQDHIKKLAMFRGQVLDNAETALREQKGCLLSLVPALTFREAWPVVQPGIETPLKPFRPGPDDKRTPRKTELGLARWLQLSLAYEEGPTDFLFYVVGDSKTDLQLARNLASLPRCKVRMYLMNPELARQQRRWLSEEVRNAFESFLPIHDSWRGLAAALEEDARSDEVGEEQLRFLLLDIDRTTILPRGLCDNEIESSREEAVQGYVEQLLGPNAVSDAAAFASDYKLSEHFPPYKHSGGDEDQRALATLLMHSGLLKAADFANPPPGVEGNDLQHWLDYILESIDPSAPGVQTLRTHLMWVRDAHDKGLGTLAPTYRQEEEEALKKLRNQFQINGHIVAAIKELCPLGITPIGYSDRPGDSMGLSLKETYTARPRDDGSSLITKIVPLAWEDSR